jgi:threonine dehydrogenase-like Zn-dependent dehydrogenase
MCLNGLYTERGIKQADGFAAERWTASPAFLVKVPPELGLAAVLLEPASILAKAWQQIERIGERSRWKPRRVLVTGAGPVGLMAALMGLQRGLEIHVTDHNETGPKPELVARLGAGYHIDFPPFEPDVVIECTGSPKVIANAVLHSAPGSIVCLAGLGTKSKDDAFDVAALNELMVLQNRVVFGTVNANLGHYRAAAQALAAADRGWLDAILTRKVPLERWGEAYEKRRGDVKTVLVFEDA